MNVRTAHTVGDPGPQGNRGQKGNQLYNTVVILSS